jgi:S1-C subfamily serine protease
VRLVLPLAVFSALALAQVGDTATPPPLLGKLRVTIALVGDNLEIRPVPLHAMALVSDGTVGESISLRTGLDGKALQEAPSGSYHLKSILPATMGGRVYRWNEPVVIRNGQTTSIELTNANAHIDSSAVPPLAARQFSSGRTVTPEIGVYERVKRGVFRIQSGLAHGSGFFADTLGGVILTNDHVVGAATSVTIVVDSVTRVVGQVVARDPEADVAVVRMARTVCADCPRLAIAAGENAAVLAGERLLAVGYPLHQDQTLTTGIASSVRNGAIISDVNINHGNSGGPLLAMHGEVVAINTFGDFTSEGGPGISGSIAIARAGKALAAAKTVLDTLPGPADTRLPMMPRTSYPLTPLKAIADTVELEPYRQFADLDAVKFEISVTTPVVAFVRARGFEDEVGKDRKKREDRSGLSKEERYSELKGKRDWDEYVGNERAPVISLAVNPKVGETGGSVFKRLMLGANLKASYKYKGDVRGVRVYRGEDSVSMILGGHEPIKAFIDNRWVELKDVADMGYYVLDPEVFQPDVSGVPPRIVVEIADLKRPDRNSCRELPIEVVAGAWNDFEPYYAGIRPGEIFVRANPKADREQSVYGEEFLKDCDWSAY